VKRPDKVQYEVVRSRRRRRLALTVTDTCSVVVKAPYGITNTAIDSFVHTHEQWIRDRLSHIRSLPKPLEHTYTEGDSFLFLGKPLTLRLAHGTQGKTSCARVADSLVVNVHVRGGQSAVKGAIEQWYRQEGLKVYRELVTRWTVTLETHHIPSIHIRSFPKRWGSCSKEGELSFAIRSLMLPYHLVEYLALHETAHMIHFNHGSDFRSTLTSHMPDWRTRQREMATLRLKVSNL